MILVITNKEDIHPNSVIDILYKRKTPVFRFNTESLLTDYDFSWWNTSSETHFFITNRQTGLQINDIILTTVWDRRPERPSELYIKGAEEINNHNLEEAYGFLRFLRSYISNVPAIGSIRFDDLACSKMEQLRVAQIVGFNIPISCFSNCKVELSRMAQQYNDLAIKPIESNGFITNEDELEYVFFTNKISYNDILNAPEDAFKQTVTFIQNYIPKSFELRVTIVAEEVFACKIESQHLSDDCGKVDWRQGYEQGLIYSKYILPLEIENKCKDYLHLMKLNFGAFDFIVTPSGDYVFLECNPNGQWVWIETETGLKISEAIANALETSYGLVTY